ncbi:MAG: hypothetical protein ACI83I_002711 [Bacteroidia bacterium]
MEIQMAKKSRVDRLKMDPIHLGLLVLAALFSIIFIGFEWNRMGDFHIYLSAASDVLKGKNIYQEVYGPAKVLHFMSSPSLALILSPLSFLPFHAASALWKFLSILFLVRSFQLVVAWLDVSSLSRKHQWAFFVLSLLASSFLIFTNFHINQLSIFLLFCILEGIHRVQDKNQNVLGGSLLAIGTIFKLLPLAGLAYLLFRGYWKAVVFAFIGIGALALLPMVIIGQDQTIFLYVEWFKVINPSNPFNTFDVSTRTIHSISSLISTLTIDEIGNVYSLNYKRNLVDWNPEVVRWVIVGAKLILFMLCVWAMNLKTIFSNEKNRIQCFWELSFILAVVPLIFPQQRSYAFVFLLPALMYFTYVLIAQSANRRPVTILVFTFIILLLNMELFVGHFREIYWHYKTITYGTLLALSLMAVLHPPKKVNDQTIASKHIE